MLKRTCRGKGGCGETKTLDQFATYFVRGKAGFRNVCKLCYNKRAALASLKNWRTNTHYRLGQMKSRSARLEKLRHYVATYLRHHPCETCGEKDLRVLQFDHIEPHKKDGAVSNLVNSVCSMKRLKAEIAKCRVLCANCHQRHTAEQGNWWIHNYVTGSPQTSSRTVPT